MQQFRYDNYTLLFNIAETSMVYYEEPSGCVATFTYFPSELWERSNDMVYGEDAYVVYKNKPENP